ncbi:MAG: DUF6510 family protein [Candidatus Nanopelagicales bacterium]
MTTQHEYVDGNRLAGPLADVFAVDITAASTSCIGCGGRSVVAQLHVYVVGGELRRPLSRTPCCATPAPRRAASSTCAAP